MEEHDIDGQTGHVARLAKRFALAYAGGIFAVKFNVLPFTEDEVMAGVSKCYIDTLKTRPMSFDEKVSKARIALFKALRSEVELDISEKNHGYSCVRLKSAKVLSSVIGGKPIKIMKSKYLLSLVPEDDVRKQLLAQLTKDGSLYCDANGRNTRPISSKIDGCSLSRSYVFFQRSRLR